MPFLINVQPLAKFSAGPDSLQSSTYTTRYNFNSLCRKQERHSVMGSKPMLSKCFSQCFSQNPQHPDGHTRLTSGGKQGFSCLGRSMTLANGRGAGLPTSQSLRAVTAYRPAPHRLALCDGPAITHRNHRHCQTPSQQGWTQVPGRLLPPSFSL